MRIAALLPRTWLALGRTRRPHRKWPSQRGNEDDHEPHCDRSNAGSRTSAGMLTPSAASAQEELATGEITPDSLRALVAAAVQATPTPRTALGGYIYRYENNAEARATDELRHAVEGQRTLGAVSGGGDHTIHVGSMTHGDS